MSANGKVYLKQNVLAEPLYNQWYAWSYLIAPQTAAMYVANWHLKVMKSFISAPQVHVAALKNPTMIGGPFMNYEPNRVDEVKALYDKTLAEQADLIEFAEAIKTLDEMLSAEAVGFTLEPIYQKMPDVLKGYVELVYDLNNHPSIRFIEGLLYKSKYYKPSSQSLALSLIYRDDRSFAFSTPRLNDGRYLHINLPLASEAIDELFKMKGEAQHPEYIKETLGIESEDDELLNSLFQGAAPDPRPAYMGDEVRIRYFGHACILIESNQCSILCDPVISYECKGGIARYTFADLPEKIDYALITHNHQDHSMFETLLQLRHKIKNVIVPKSNGGSLADPSLKQVLLNAGFTRTREIDEMETLEIEGGSITGLPFLGEHADLDIRTKTAWLINAKGNLILCAADSNNISPELYGHIAALCGEIDVLFLGMECDGAPMTWLYGPLLTRPLARKMDQTRRFSGSDHLKGMDIIRRLNPKQVYVYAMGQEPWLTYLTSIQYTEESRPIVESNKLVEECRNSGIPSERLYGKKEFTLS